MMIRSGVRPLTHNRYGAHVIQALSHSVAPETYSTSIIPAIQLRRWRYFVIILQLVYTTCSDDD